MATQEISSNFQNFTLENKFPELEELKQKGYVGFGAIAIILNEKHEILIIQENKDKKGHAKLGKWSLVYETGKEGETPEMTMLAGIGSELGLETLQRVKQLSNRNFGFDFRRYEGDKPSRSLISIFYLPADQIPNKSQWGIEVRDLQWIASKKLLNLDKSILRVNVSTIIEELKQRKLLTFSENELVNLALSPALIKDYLSKREEIPDLFWK